MVKIRMKRMGRPHRPFYRINAVDSRVKRDGKVIENLGWYDPMAPGKNYELNAERIKHWLDHGAQPSETIMDLLAKNGLVDAEKWAKRQAWRTEAKKKAAAARAAAGKKDEAKA
ncbi:MAG: 30S ribosomal protein S16 [Planctomycetaceae bacterium]|nr:30S ribosomal protein S16 [Planctomycetaceae bacterium]